MKLVNFKLKHPCITALFEHVPAYPFYIVLCAIYAHLVAVYQNAMFGTYWRVTQEGLIPRLALIAALPWMINTIVYVIAAYRPFSTYGFFVCNYHVFIQDAIFYLSIAILFDIGFGGFTLSSHLALITILLPGYIIRTIIYLIWIRKIKKIDFKY